MPGNVIDGFVVITRDGQLKTHGRGRSLIGGPARPARIYPTHGRAKNFASDDGDSVVPIHINLEMAKPTFIRGKLYAI